MNALKLIFLLIVFPLLLAALGGWERQRADDSTTTMIDYHITVDIAKQQLQALAAKDPVASVDLVDETISVQLALSRLEKIETELPMAHKINRGLRALTPWVIGMGLLAALIGGPRWYALGRAPRAAVAGKVVAGVRPGQPFVALRIGEPCGGNGRVGRGRACIA